MNEKYVFIKSFTNNEGTIPENSEIMIFRGFVYFNGGLVSPAYQKFLLNFINDEKLRKEYLTKVKMIQNKV